MENIKELMINVKDRFTNPLIFSFLCSWLVYNWQIPIALFFVNSSQIEKAGFKTTFDFIKDKINVFDGLIYPFLFGIGYTLFFPVVKTLIRAFNSRIGKWSENWNLKILKDGKISIEKYFVLRKDYEIKRQYLEEVIESESGTMENYNRVNSDLNNYISKNSELSKQINEKTNFEYQLYNVRVLNGYWTNTFLNTKTGVRGSEEIYIEDGKYFTIGEFANKIPSFEITNFNFDSRNRRMFFIKEKTQQQELFNPKEGYRYNINILYLEKEDLLNGAENLDIKIEYRKKDTNMLTPEEKK